MSRYLDLLKQIPPGKEEIPDILFKKLDIAAANLMTNHAGQYDPTEEEKRCCINDDCGPFEVYYGERGNWGLLDKWPVELGELMISSDKVSSEWYLGLSVNGNPYVWFEKGSKEHIKDLGRELNKLRETEGEEAFKTEIMSLIDDDLRGWD